MVEQRVGQNLKYFSLLYCHDLLKVCSIAKEESPTRLVNCPDLRVRPAFLCHHLKHYLCGLEYLQHFETFTLVFLYISSIFV